MLRKNGFWTRDSTFLVANDILGMPKNQNQKPKICNLLNVHRFIVWTNLENILKENLFEVQTRSWWSRIITSLEIILEKFQYNPKNIRYLVRLFRTSSDLHPSSPFDLLDHLQNVSFVLLKICPSPLLDVYTLNGIHVNTSLCMHTIGNCIPFWSNNKQHRGSLGNELLRGRANLIRRWGHDYFSAGFATGIKDVQTTPIWGLTRDERLLPTVCAASSMSHA